MNINSQPQVNQWMDMHPDATVSDFYWQCIYKPVPGTDFNQPRQIVTIDKTLKRELLERKNITPFNGSKLKQLRKQHNLTQGELWLKIGYLDYTSRIGAIENGKGPVISIKEEQLICDYFGVDSKYFRQ